MTASFDEFMRQHGMTGSEKADGYSDDVFVGLADDEKETVFQLLVSELPWSARWLFLLDPVRALVVAKDIEGPLRGKPYSSVYMLQLQMVRYSGDLTYQRHMIEDFATCSADERKQAIRSICRTPASRPLVEFLKATIFSDDDDDVVWWASHGLLQAASSLAGAEMEQETFARLHGALCSGDVDLKAQAMCEVEQSAGYLALMAQGGCGD